MVHNGRTWCSRVEFGVVTGSSSLWRLYVEGTPPTIPVPKDSATSNPKSLPSACHTATELLPYNASLFSHANPHPNPNHQRSLIRDLATDILATISPSKSASQSRSYHIHILEVVDLGFDFIHCAHVCLGLGLGFKELQKRILADPKIGKENRRA